MPVQVQHKTRMERIPQSVLRPLDPRNQLHRFISRDLQFDFWKEASLLRRHGQYCWTTVTLRFIEKQGRIWRRPILLDRGMLDKKHYQPAGDVTDRILEGKNDRIIVQLVAGCQQPRSRNPIEEERASKQQQPGAGIQEAHFVAVDVERQNQRRQTSASQ